MMNKRHTWELVAEKQAELRRLTEENWNKGEWELAALGERVLRTVEDSTAASEELHHNMAALNYEVSRLRQKHLTS